MSSKQLNKHSPKHTFSSKIPIASHTHAYTSPGAVAFELFQLNFYSLSTHLVAKPEICLSPVCASFANTLQHTATHCNALRHTATHCNTLQLTATHCNTLQHRWACRIGDARLFYCHTATHCNTLQHTATPCDTLHTLQHMSVSVTSCETLTQHLCLSLLTVLQKSKFGGET